MSGMRAQRSTCIEPSLSSIYRSIVNEAAATSPIQPIVNMGQGFLLVLALELIKCESGEES